MQVVLIGDHKQLRPIVMNSVASDLGLSQSLFERYATMRTKMIMLEEQYRMVRTTKKSSKYTNRRCSLVQYAFVLIIIIESSSEQDDLQVSV